MTCTARLIIGIFLGFAMLLVALLAGAEGSTPTTLRATSVAVAVGAFLLFAEPILQVVGFALGHLTLPLLTFGRARAESSTDHILFPWYGVARPAGGKAVVETEAVAIVGLAVGVVAIVGTVLVYHALT